MDHVLRDSSPCFVFYTLMESRDHLPTSFAWRLPLGNFLWLFTGNLVGLQFVFFSVNVDVCPILFVLFMLLAKNQSHPEFLVLVNEAVPVKGIILSECKHVF